MTSYLKLIIIIKKYLVSTKINLIMSQWGKYLLNLKQIINTVLMKLLSKIINKKLHKIQQNVKVDIL